MPIERSLIILTAEGTLVSAAGLVVHKRRRAGVKRNLALVLDGDSTRRLGPERYHVLETGWIVAVGWRPV